nr:MAG TPA_asm: hypothetical protein [Caudoviricetes sp.]
MEEYEMSKITFDEEARIKLLEEQVEMLKN